MSRLSPVAAGALLFGLATTTAAPAIAQGCGAWTRASKRSEASPKAPSSLVVSARELAGRLEDGRTIVLQIGPDRASYDEGHIPGARFIPPTAFAVERNGLETELPPIPLLKETLESLGLSNDNPIVIAGDPLWSARLFFTLDYLGLGDHTAILDGGFEGWRDSSYPISTTAPGIEPGRLTLKANRDVVATTGDVDRANTTKTAQVLDARTLEEYIGQRGGRTIDRPGHIPGAVLLNWVDVLDESGHFKDRESIAGMLSEAGVEAGQPLITYCRVGHRASMLYFIGRWLGREVRLYDGSYQEWSRNPSRPVSTASPSTGSGA